MLEEAPAVAASTPAEEVGLSVDQAAARISAWLSAKEDATTQSGVTPPAADAPAHDAPAPSSETSPPPVSPRFTVTVDGHEEEVDEAELKKGYSRQASSTRKSQALAAERKAFEQDKLADKDGVRVERERYKAILPQLEGIIQRAVDAYTGVNWEQLRADDPTAFAEHRAAYSLQQERLATVQKERAVTDAKLAEERDAGDRQETEREAVLLLEKIPEWKDDAKRNEELGKIESWAVSAFGYTPEELAGWKDHRAYQVIRMAFQFSELEANAKSAGRKVEVVKQAVAPGGKKAERDPSGRYAAARERLRKTGRVEDAAAAITALYDRES